MADDTEIVVPMLDDSGESRELENLLAKAVTRSDGAGSSVALHGVKIGSLVGFREPHEPLVIYAGQPYSEALIARATVELLPDDIGRDVVLAFENGDPLKPLITGRLRMPSSWPTRSCSRDVDVEADGQRLTLTARSQLVLRCGVSSITLTADGKILIQGAYVSSRSSGVMRIKGGSVQIN